MSRKPNIQNVPRDSRLKEIFVPEEGYSYVYYDYSQIEFRVWVHLAKDPVGTKFINEGKDIHTYIASRFWKVTEEEVSKKQRDIIKSVVYGSLYGRTPESIAQEHQISVDEAKQIQRTFFNICKKGYFWLKQTGQEAEKNKKVKTPFGTFKLLPDLDMSLGYKKEEMIRSAINFVVQSWAVELVYIGAYKVWKEIQKQGLDACYVHQIHDAGILEVRDSQVKQVIEIIKQFANNPVKLSIPIVAEIKTGKSWATLQTVE
jgi:DNA polymerase-1